MSSSTTALLVAAQELAHCRGTADRPAAGPVHDGRILLDLLEMPLPDTGASRGMHAGHVVVHDPEGEESATHPEPVDGLLIGRGDHHREIAADGKDVGVHLRRDGCAVLLELLVIAVDSLCQRSGPGVGEAQCAEASLRGHLPPTPGAYRRPTPAGAASAAVWEPRCAGASRCAGP